LKEGQEVSEEGTGVEVKPAVTEKAEGNEAKAASQQDSKSANKN